MDDNKNHDVIKAKYRESAIKTTVVDTPLSSKQDDLLHLNNFYDAVIDYIRNANTPITIALQGEWGSGKTSLMNAIQEELCKHDKTSQFFGIWINTWQFTLLDSSSQVVIDILGAIVKQIAVLNPDSEYAKSVDELLNKIMKMVKFSYNAIAVPLMMLNGINIAIPNSIAKALGACINNNNSSSVSFDKASLIEQLKNNIEGLIQDTMSLSCYDDKKGFIFFIDDLDRVSPFLAVEVLDILKNVFDFEYCIFIIAVDYAVIIKGLEPKFGELTIENENKFRVYFDKLIQLSITIPQSSLLVFDLITKALDDICFFGNNNTPARNEVDSDLLTFLQNTVNSSVGSNPRYIKKLINIVSLTKKLGDWHWNNMNWVGGKYVYGDRDGDYEQTTFRDLIHIRKLTFALICLQVSYPTIYHLLSINPDYSNWDNEFASRIKAPVLIGNDMSDLSGIIRQLKNKEKKGESCFVSNHEVGEFECALFRICKLDRNLECNYIKIISIFDAIDDEYQRYSTSVNIKEELKSLMTNLSITNTNSVLFKSLYHVI